jgi:hypothetical protein
MKQSSANQAARKGDAFAEILMEYIIMRLDITMRVLMRRRLTWL